MKRECEIVRDLIPLYVDDIASESSREFVDEHCESCAQCRSERDAAVTPLGTVEEKTGTPDKIWSQVAHKKKEKETTIAIIGVIIYTALNAFIICTLVLEMLLSVFFIVVISNIIDLPYHSEQLPEDGVWYCEELLIAVEFENNRPAHAIKFDDNKKKSGEAVNVQILSDSAQIFVFGDENVIDVSLDYEGDGEYIFTLYGDGDEMYYFERTDYDSIEEMTGAAEIRVP